MSLEGKTALVTGGSRGIGRAVSLSLAGAGADVIITYHRNRAAAEDTVAAITDLGRRASAHAFNAAADTGVDGLFDAVAGDPGHLDIFVNNAVSAVLRPLLELSPRHWDHVMQANLTVFFSSARRVVPLMTRGGTIIAISSLGPSRYIRGYGALAAAKAGLETLVRYLSVELASHNINVNTVCPGVVDTEALQAFQAVTDDLDQFKSGMQQRTPTKRLQTPEDVAGVVRFLCQPEASTIRGQRIVMDDGLAFGM